MDAFSLLRFTAPSDIPDWAYRECDPLPVTPESLSDAERTLLAQVDQHEDVKAAAVLYRDDCSGVLTVAVEGYTPSECAFGYRNQLCLPDELVDIAAGMPDPVMTFDAAHSGRDFNSLIDDLQTSAAEAWYESQQYG